MSVNPRNARRGPIARIRAARWPSKDHRDYQTVSRLQLWRSRRAQAAPADGACADRPGGTQLPALGRIVDVRRENALLYVDLQARRATLDSRELALAATTAGHTVDRLPDGGGEGRTWTMTLALN
jgi:hypothetical protein